MAAISEAATTDRSPQTPQGAFFGRAVPLTLTPRPLLPRAQLLLRGVLGLVRVAMAMAICCHASGEGLKRGSGGGRRPGRSTGRRRTLLGSNGMRSVSEFLPAIEGSVTAYELCGAGAR